MKVLFFVAIAVIITLGCGESTKRIEKRSRYKRFEGYKDIAKSSGGLVMNSKKEEIKISELLTNMTIRNIENRIFYVEDEENQTFYFNTNSLTKETYVVVNSLSNVEEVLITSPSGSKSDYLINAQEPSLFVGAISKPTEGLWKVEVKLKNQRKGYTALVAATSSLYVTPGVYDLSGADIESSTKLIPGDEYAIQALIMPEITGANITMTCLSSRRSSLCDENVLRNNYVGTFRCPNKEFYINFEGVLEDGGRFQRWMPVIRGVNSTNEHSEAVPSATKLATSFEITPKNSHEKVTFKSTEIPVEPTSSSTAGKMKNLNSIFFLLILIITFNYNYI